LPSPAKNRQSSWTFLLTHWDSTDDFFIDAPTGVGKSPVNLTIARHQAEQGRRSYISTTTVALEDQYVREFHKFGLRQLHSKVRYPCSFWQNCDVGHLPKITTQQEQPCPDDDDSDGDRKPKKKKPETRCSDPACAYKAARAVFEATSYGVANSAFLLSCARFVPSFNTRHLLIVDEAHTFADQICGLYGVQLETWNVGPDPVEGEECDWIKRHFLPCLKHKLFAEMAYLGKLPANDPQIEKQTKKVRSLELKLSNVDLILSSEPRLWVFDRRIEADRRKDNLSISPIWASKAAPPLIQKLGLKRVFTSATLPNFERQARWLGINPHSPRTRYLQLSSPFPVENRPIYSYPIINWDHRRPEASWAQGATELKRILAKHHDERGLVHVSSYIQAREIARLLNSPRVLTHSNSDERAESLEQMFSTPGSVLISPSSREGLDLYGERSQFQVVLKLPFAFLGDKRVIKRKKEDPGWYSLHTAQQLVQAAGRSIRSHTDVAPTYILDAGWPRFLAAHRAFFPDYFLNACREQPGY
jgi:Rad3-related DNA helicase